MQVQLIEVKVRNLNWIFLYWKHIITHYLLQCFLAAWKNMFKETVCVTSSYSSGKDGPALVTAIPLSCTMCLFVFNSHNPGYMFSCFPVTEMLKIFLYRSHNRFFFSKLYSYLIRQSFKGYHGESGIVIFAWKNNWNYAYSPFNKITGIQTKIKKYHFLYQPFNYSK